ncbi:MAG: hypothetical protein LBC10_02710 [Deltaproteobacteria bacterium]|nr:hypothetical protein [Deltaproteobacteria bacterium]
MSHRILPLSPTWSGDVLEALILEAAGLPAPEQPEPERLAPDLPRAELAAAQDRFGRSLHAARIGTRRGEYVAVWLESGVEAEVDAAWAAGPERAFWLHAVARSLCLATVRDVAPEVAAYGCAAVPGPDPELAAALRLAGLACGDMGEGHAVPLLGRRYAVVTWAFAGGCGKCALASRCPRSGFAPERASAEFDPGQ